MKSLINNNIFSKSHYKKFEIIKKISYYIDSVKYAYQRIKYGVSEKDAWDLDYYIARTISNGLKMLAKNSHGEPVGFPRQIEGKEELQTWEEFLNDLADKFSIAVDYWDDDIEKAWDDYEKSCDGKIFEEPQTKEAAEKYLIWSNKMEEVEEFQNEQKNIAFKLLSQYFYNLWD